MKTKYLKIHQVFLLLYFFSMLNISYAQKITDVKIIPTNPTENDTVKIEVSSTHSYSASVLNHSFGVTTLTINYCYDSLPVITNRVDTFSVGAKLVAETYDLSIILIVDIPCISSLKTDTFDITFTVTLVNAMIDNPYQDNYTITTYPNPFTTSVTIEISNIRYPVSNFKLLIYDVLGQEVYQSAISNSQFAIHPNLPSRIYFYQISDKEKNIARGKLVKQ